MGSRRYSSVVAANVRSAISATGNTPESVAEATDLTISTLNARLSGRTPFSFSELVTVGGFLHVEPADFMEVHA